MSALETFVRTERLASSLDSPGIGENDYHIRRQPSILELETSIYAKQNPNGELIGQNSHRGRGHLGSYCERFTSLSSASSVRTMTLTSFKIPSPLSLPSGPTISSSLTPLPSSVV